MSIAYTHRVPLFFVFVGEMSYENEQRRAI